MRIAGISVVIAVVVMMTGLPTASATAQGGASRTLTIYAAECPAGYTGNASADECDDNPITGVPFRVGRPFTEAFTDFVPTDSEGLVTFEVAGLPLNGVLRIIEQLPAGTERFVAYCVDDSDNPLGISYPNDVGNPALGVADVAVGDLGDVACDWYNVPKASRSTEQPTTVFQGPPSACTEAPAPTPTPDASLNLPGYVAIYSDGAIFATWTDSNGALSGTLYVTSTNNESQDGFESQVVGFTGIRSGDQVSLTIPQGFGFAMTISGTQTGETLTLYFVDDSGNPVATVFHRGSIAEYDQAVRMLRQQREQLTACTQAVEATATAIAQEQDAVTSANADLDNALQQLTTDVDGLATGTNFDAVLRAYADDWATMQNDDQKMRTAAVVQPFDCYQLSNVEYALSQISYGLTQINYDASSLSYVVDEINSDIESVQNDIAAVEGAFQRLQDAAAANTADTPRPWFSQDDISTALSNAQQQIDDAEVAIQEAQEEATGYDQKASQLLLDAQTFVDGLTCSS